MTEDLWTQIRTDLSNVMLPSILVMLLAAAIDTTSKTSYIAFDARLCAGITKD
eukprot:CAMPEP_0114473964 /NCGR_PEP_ID=MMETSP0104-20121206/13289_1 /TAXON_ID=37642 ORGANISM="Paraphysomonas imperforata, Strain PA2" /NCGR_SAMPLE_ID=MMETSP0104 /ASSEMBLY_ACC=CAM_ASM_000202 /LENGTH=52 /DNA_ID=CAMNT_0001648237 /DNA_START=325 /DNA_END=483 /DNA_ORIENTATION=+